MLLAESSLKQKQMQKSFVMEKMLTLKFILGELPADERTFIPAKTEISTDPLGLKIEDLSEENSRPS
jgi:hypothetical protein